MDVTRVGTAALGIDLGTILPANNGRIGHAELDAFLSRRQPVEKAEDKAAQKPVEKLSGAGETIRVIGLRRKIAEAMSQVKIARG